MPDDTTSLCSVTVTSQNFSHPKTKCKVVCFSPQVTKLVFDLGPVTFQQSLGLLGKSRKQFFVFFYDLKQEPFVVNPASSMLW